MNDPILFSSSRSIVSVRKIVCLLNAALFLLTCDHNPLPSPPGFSDLTPLAEKSFVAYASPDRQSKPDTVTISWSFTGMALRSIRAKATIDSGKTWIGIGDAVPEGSGRAQVRWVPGDDTANFGYFGEKECIIDISDTVSTASVESDPFTILGSQPLILLSPTGGETYPVNDSVAITYQINSDRISNIRVFFINNIIDDWVELVSTTRLTDSSRPPLRSYTALFVPADYEVVLGYYSTSPIRFLLKDYDSPLPGSSVKSGDIFLVP